MVWCSTLVYWWSIYSFILTARIGIVNYLSLSYLGLLHVRIRLSHMVVSDNDRIFSNYTIQQYFKDCYRIAFTSTYIEYYCWIIVICLKGRRVWVSSPTTFVRTISKKYLLYFAIHPAAAAKKKRTKFTHDCFPTIFSSEMTKSNS